MNKTTPKPKNKKPRCPCCITCPKYGKECSYCLFNYPDDKINKTTPDKCCDKCNRLMPKNNWQGTRKGCINGVCPCHTPTPDKEKIREEFEKWCAEHKPFLNFHNQIDISGWWLCKMEAQKASTIAIIEGVKRKEKWLNQFEKIVPFIHAKHMTKAGKEDRIKDFIRQTLAAALNDLLEKLK